MKKSIFHEFKRIVAEVEKGKKQKLIHSYSLPLVDQIQNRIDQNLTIQTTNPLYAFIALASDQRRVLYLSDQYSKTDFVKILISELSGNSIETLFSGKMTENQWKNCVNAMSLISNWKFDFAKVTKSTLLHQFKKDFDYFILDLDIDDFLSKKEKKRIFDYANSGNIRIILKRD